MGSAALADNCGNGHVTPRGGNSPVDLEPEPVWRSGKAPCENVLRSLRVGKARSQAQVEAHGVGLRFHDGTFYFNTSTVVSTFKPLSATK